MSYFDLDDKEFIVGLQELIREDEIYEEARIMVEFIEGIEEAMKKEKEAEEEKEKARKEKEKEVPPQQPRKKRMKLPVSSKKKIIIVDDDDDVDADDGDNDDCADEASGMRATFAEKEQQQRYLEEIIKKYND
jgi:hypothetical protein